MKSCCEKAPQFVLPCSCHTFQRAIRRTSVSVTSAFTFLFGALPTFFRRLSSPFTARAVATLNCRLNLKERRSKNKKKRHNHLGRGRSSSSVDLLLELTLLQVQVTLLYIGIKHFYSCRKDRKGFRFFKAAKVFRCSLPKAMSISRSEIFRKKRKRPENEKSRKVMGVQWEVLGGQ